MRLSKIAPLVWPGRDWHCGVYGLRSGYMLSALSAANWLDGLITLQGLNGLRASISMGLRLLLADGLRAPLIMDLCLLLADGLRATYDMGLRLLLAEGLRAPYDMGLGLLLADGLRRLGGFVQFRLWYKTRFTQALLE